MPRFHNINNIRIQFTEEEEVVRDIEEAQAVIDGAVEEEKVTKTIALEAKLADDSITFEEMKELMRLR